MAELNQNSQTSTGTPAGTPASADPFESLFKMSKTAGLGSGEYVAINGTSIAAILVGIASAIVLFKVIFLLLVPLIGIILGILAFRQIRDSNGTQTGEWLAVGGLLLSLGFGGFAAVSQGGEMIRNHSDSEKISVLVKRLGDDISHEKFDDAYAMVDDRFRAKNNSEVFTQRLKLANANAMFGKITGFETTEVTKFDEDAVTGERVCSALVKVSYERVTGTERLPLIFRLRNGDWQLDDIPGMFPDQKAAAAPAAGPTGPAGPPAPAGPPK